MGYGTITGKVFLFCALFMLVVGGVTILYFKHQIEKVPKCQKN